MSRYDIYQMDKDYVQVTFDSTTRFNQAVDWCEEKGWEDFVLGGNTIYFAIEQQATMCVLRWSS